LLALVETLEGGALDDPSVAREFLDRMHVEVDRLTQMVEELLELARIESGRIQLRFRKANVSRVVREAAERLRPQAERQNLTLTVSAPDGPVEAVVDGDRLHQVIVNLVHNAVKFTPPGGAIRIHVEAREGQVAISVADTGIGVSQADLPRLFERFYKADRSRSSPGTGLGLAIVKHVVQAHSGTVRAESAGRGLGTTFVVTLPSGLGTRERAAGGTRLGRAVPAVASPATAMPAVTSDLAG
jgi:two-component system phosphate regulon sensor histidine kinase PhoR